MQILALWDLTLKEDPHPISHSCGSHQHHPGHPMHVVSEQHNSSNNTSSASSTTRLVRLEGHRENAGSVLGLAALPLSHTSSHTFHVDDTLADNFEPSLSTVHSATGLFFQLPSGADVAIGPILPILSKSKCIDHICKT